MTTTAADTTINASWICYPGDFELWLHREVSMRRDERLTVIPPFFRLDTHNTSVKFRKWVDYSKEEEVTVYAEGIYNITIDDLFVYGNPASFTIPPGRHLIMVSIVAESFVPAIYTRGAAFDSDETWEVSNNNHIWHPVSCLQLYSPEEKPSQYKLATTLITPVLVKPLVNADTTKQSVLLDFGKETFGYAQLHRLKGTGKINLFYGESLEEAMAGHSCETYDELLVDEEAAQNIIIQHSRAFRYIKVVYDQAIQIKAFGALYEYLPVEYRGAFRCSNDRLNDIWDTSLYTLHLTSREIFLDGIKRDRWAWSGDAYQSYLMNYYSFFNNEVCQRTIIALRGKDPVETHINHILDYSFYWIIALHDYYLYTGDLSFVRKMYAKMLSLLQFCIGRTNESGFMEGLPGDWVFVDWGAMDNKGEVCFEQLLFCRSLEIASQFASMFEEEKIAASYEARAVELKEKIMNTFWDEKIGGLQHSRHEGQLTNQVTKYATMFALSYGYFTPEQAETAIRSIMLNSDVQPITTPYMRFYELASLCELGEFSYVTQELIQYWGGMLDLGATSFWETFDPALSGEEHYAMYGRAFGKSLCHAWGASPIYILGKYYLGVRPTAAGYASYIIEPNLGGLEWIEGAVPTPNGNIEVYADTSKIKVFSPAGEGILRFSSTSTPTSSHGTITHEQGNYYLITIELNTTYEIQYSYEGSIISS